MANPKRGNKSIKSLLLTCRSWSRFLSSLSILIGANKRVYLCVCVRAHACVHLRVRAHAKMCVMVCC